MGPRGPPGPAGAPVSTESFLLSDSIDGFKLRVSLWGSTLFPHFTF